MSGSRPWIVDQPMLLPPSIAIAREERLDFMALTGLERARAAEHAAPNRSAAPKGAPTPPRTATTANEARGDEPREVEELLPRYLGAGPGDDVAAKWAYLGHAPSLRA